LIVSVSGIRGIVNEDMSLEELCRFAGNFAKIAGSKEVLLAMDSRSTGPSIGRAVAAGMMSRGVKVLNYGIISTPALFRESRLRRKPAIMITASHNEPEFNGLKFIMDGMGIGNDSLEAVVDGSKRSREEFGAGSVKTVPSSAYVEDLVKIFGAGSCEGVRVALDLGGGAAISHSVQILRRLGCDVVSINDSYGVFNRKVDPVADDLVVLRKLVKEEKFHLGLGFDCDGDRLVIVDADGRKRSGDYMLTLALSELLEDTGEKKAVVSLDTTQAVDVVLKRVGGEVFRSKVGEVNVVGKMRKVGARLGGEGSSGGLIDGSFNYCRDSMLAALVIVKALKAKGRVVYDSVPTFHQERIALALPRAKALRGIQRLAKKYGDVDSTDGMKVRLSKRAWVLIRASGTEDLVRVSAEAESATEAAKIAKSFAGKLEELSS
jgi:phosphomannomutase